MSVSVVADREARSRDGPQRGAVPLPPRAGTELGGYLCGRRLYETMLVWETDASLRGDELGAAFADVWCAIPKVVFSRTLDSVQGNTRLAASLAEEVAAALDATDKDVSIGAQRGQVAAQAPLGEHPEAAIDRGHRYSHPADGPATRRRPPQSVLVGPLGAR